MFCCLALISYRAPGRTVGRRNALVMRAALPERSAASTASGARQWLVSLRQSFPNWELQSKTHRDGASRL